MQHEGQHPGAAAERSSRGRTSRARRRLLALGLAAAVSVGALEAGLRVAFADGTFLGYSVPPLGALTNADQRAWIESAQRQELGQDAGGSETVSRFDPELGWTVRTGHSEAGKRVSTNSWGARGTREYEEEPAAGMLRVASFGDSFTWCDEVADDDAWQAQIEGYDPRLEVLNFGVAGYGTDQALLRFRREGLHGARFVVIGIMLENIGRNVNRYRPLWYPRSRAAVTKPRFVLEPGGALRLVPQPFTTRQELCDAVLDGSVLEHVRDHEYWLERPAPGIASHFAIGRLLLLGRMKMARQPRLLWPTAGEPRAVTLALIKSFHAEVLEAGAESALVLVFPRESDLDDLEEAGQAYWQPAFDELNSEGIAHLDLAPELIAARQAEPEVSLYGGGHLNAAGNGIVSRELTEWLKVQVQ